MRVTSRLSTITLTLICVAGVLPVSALAADAAPVLAQELVNVRATRTAATASALQVQQPGPALVQVWLLKADGTQVLPAHGASPPKPEGFPGGIRTTSYTYTWSFPLAGTCEAVAAVVKINDEFFVDQLNPLR